jgi:hypothetical protein
MNYENVASGYALLKKGLSSAVTVAASSIKQAKEVVTEVRCHLASHTRLGAWALRRAPEQRATPPLPACRGRRAPAPALVSAPTRQELLRRAAHTHLPRPRARPARSPRM